MGMGIMTNRRVKTIFTGCMVGILLAATEPGYARHSPSSVDDLMIAKTVVASLGPGPQCLNVLAFESDLSRAWAYARPVARLSRSP
jgi:hypothetical protein